MWSRCCVNVPERPRKVGRFRTVHGSLIFTLRRRFPRNKMPNRLNCPTVLPLARKPKRLTGDYESRIAVTNSHSERSSWLEGTTWQPVPPPQRGQPRAAFHAYMLMPGFSLAFHAVTLCRSRSSILAYRTAAVQAARADEVIATIMETLIGDMRAEHGLQMAQRRGSSQLPYWSRLAICEFRKRGLSRSEIAAAFRCSLGTVANALQGRGCSYERLSGRRQLTPPQSCPPGLWKGGTSRASN